MSMMSRIGNRGELLRQADIARSLGSPFVALVLEAGERQLHRAIRTEALIAQWPGDPAAAALAMRFNGGLHALARCGRFDALSALYRGQHEDFDGAIGTALEEGDDFLADWMRHPTQTNEVGRAAAIISALMVAQRRFGLPFELLEIGSSCGLNLNLARYSYDLGGEAAGVAPSPVRIAPEWRGFPPPIAPVDVVAARGVDLSPLSPPTPATRERLLSYIWADQHERSARLEQALDLACRYPPQVDQANAVTWLDGQLTTPQASGLCRVVFHSMVLQYLSEHERARVTESVMAAGARATTDRPLAWISFEWTPDRREVRLTLTCWPTNEAQVLAVCHPYGDWIDWRV